MVKATLMAVPETWMLLYKKYMGQFVPWWQKHLISRIGLRIFGGTYLPLSQALKLFRTTKKKGKIITGVFETCIKLLIYSYTKRFWAFLFLSTVLFGVSHWKKYCFRCLFPIKIILEKQRYFIWFLWKQCHGYWKE